MESPLSKKNSYYIKTPRQFGVFVKKVFQFSYICFSLHLKLVFVFLSFICFPFLAFSQEKESKALNQFLNHLLEAGVFQFTKNNQKQPEELSSVISSLRIRNLFLSNSNTFEFQESEIQKKQNPQEYISYTVFSDTSHFFINLTQKFSYNQTELRRYYDTNNNFTLDAYINNYRESKFKFGFGPLDYFHDSWEMSLYYRKMQTNGNYSLQTRKIPPAYIRLVGNSAESYLLYNLSNDGNFSYVHGTNKVIVEGLGFVFGWNFRFLEVFSFYNSLDLYYFRMNANLSTFSPSVEFYNDYKKRLEYGSQILHVNKILNLNLNMYYEVGFTITFANVGFKWGTYWFPI
ncbi:MAG: hypothetical protein N3A69_16690 [Leptospiraceae bacterium]|nr:hypothetical protein [Leptospiraceae bacterium]